MDLKMKTTIVEANTRAIRTQWTAEMAKDLSSYHGIDADKELNRILRAEWRKRKASNIFRR
jgi:hypothetical protein